MVLSAEKKRAYRTLGHKLNPVVMIAGKGLTENVIAATSLALNDHELIKVRISVDDREARASLIQSLCRETASELVQSIGKVVLLFKKAKEANPRLSNLVRLIG